MHGCGKTRTIRGILEEMDGSRVQLLHLEVDAQLQLMSGLITPSAVILDCQCEFQQRLQVFMGELRAVPVLI